MMNHRSHDLLGCFHISPHDFSSISAKSLSRFTPWSQDQFFLVQQGHHLIFANQQGKQMDKGRDLFEGLLPVQNLFDAIVSFFCGLALTLWLPGAPGTNQKHPDVSIRKTKTTYLCLLSLLSLKRVKTCS